MGEDNIKVSIICNAYNHEDYIKHALDGFVSQKTNFKFEILVHDDASTDNTPNIIREYEKKYPNLIFPIYQTENQYSKNPKLIFDIQVSRVRGQYIALCEGDDFWTDPYKLQKQFNALENNNNIDICATGYKLVEPDTYKFISSKSLSANAKLFTIEDVILGGGGFVGTPTLFYRAAVEKNRMRFFNNLHYDYSLQISGALKGGILYLPDCTACVTVFSKNSWTSRMAQNPDKKIKFNKKVIEMLRQFDEDTNFKYHDTVEMAINREIYDSQAIKKDYKGMMENPYYKYIGFKHRIRPFIRRYFKIEI